MLQKYRYFQDEPKTADSCTRQFYPISTSNASTFYSKLSQQITYSRKGKRLNRPTRAIGSTDENGDKVEQRNNSSSFEQKLQKDLITQEVSDWGNFMKKEHEMIQKLNDQAEKQGERRSSNKFSEPKSPLKKAKSSADLRIKNNSASDRELFFLKMHLGNKNVASLNGKDFHQTIRHEPKLHDYARLYNQQPQNLYLSLNFEQSHRIPKGFGLVQNTNKVNSSRYLRTKQDVRAFSSAMGTRQVKTVTSMQLNNNLFDCMQLREIFQSFPPSVKDLELVDCKLNFKHVEIIMQFTTKSMIQKLNLEQNFLRDQGCKLVMKHLMNNSTLQLINLNNNKITDQSCIQISNLLKQTQRLYELYLGYNHFTQNGGTQIWKSMYKNTSVKILDMSHNAIASLECAQSVAKAISRPYNELLHLDLSYNKFTPIQAQIIAESLIKNETIYGFHFEGNHQKIIINPNGFLVNLEEQKILNKKKLELLNQEPQVFKLLDEDKEEAQSDQEEEDVWSFHRFRKIKSTKLAVQLVNRVNRLDTCWICEGWQETKFEWTPHQSGSMFDDPIFIHIDFDGYRPLLMTHINNEFFLVKMCPPNTKVRYFFSNPIMGIQTVANDQNQEQFQLRQQPFLYNDEILVDGNSMSILNEIHISDNQNLFDKYMNLMQCKPREKLALFDFSAYLKTKKVCWSVETSIFRYFQPDSDTLIDECFEFDYQNSKVARLVKETELNDSKEILRVFYRQLFHTYKYFASGNNNQIPCLTFVEYIEFLVQTDLMEGQKTNDIDISFTSTAGAKDVTFPQAYEKGLVRCQLLEIMIRLCNDKYIRPGVCVTMQDALQLLMNQCQEYFSRFDQVQKWRKIRYWTQKCDIMIHDRMSMFKLLYKYTCKLSKKAQQFKSDFVSAQDFKDMLTQCKFIGDDLTERECNLAYLQSMQTQKDELFQAKHYQMNFYEFLEGCCKCAEKLSIIRGDKVMEIDDRRAKDLQVKIDGFLLLIYLTIGNDMKTALPHDNDSKQVDKCMINDYKTLKQKLEDSFTDEDKPPYNPIVELGHLQNQVSQNSEKQSNKKQSLRQQLKQTKKEENAYSMISFGSYFEKIQKMV